MEKKECAVALLVEMQIGTITRQKKKKKKGGWVQKRKKKVPKDSAIPPLEIYPEKVIIENVHWSNIYNGEDMETT